jgi:S-DNA-T family DNA segregation ATPase FtsK/SpoIIIE
MIGSIVLWAVMKSPYVLVFALLGPLVAVASLGDAALQNRRRAAKERKRFAAELGRARDAIAAAHGREAAALAAEHRNARTLAAASRRDPERWTGSGDSFLPVVAGVGRVRSTLEFDGTDPAPSGAAAGARAEQFARELAALRSAAQTVDGAPVVVDAARGIGLCGPPVLAAACARGIVLQMANALSPADYELVVTGGRGADWLAALPHTVVAGSEVRAEASLSVEFRAAESSVLVAVAPTLDAVPPECKVVLHVDDAASARLVPHPPGLTGPIAPELVSLEQARAVAALLSEAARAAGLGSGSDPLPESLPFRTLHPEDSPAVRTGADDARGSLACTPAWGAAGPVVLDLVTDGPHAIVGGTTGSGKSEFLVSWVLAMAARHPPDAVTFLLVDFKGGAAFTEVQRLPHSVGVITDLDERSAHRALTSLRAELRYRERALADAGVR